MRVLVPCAVLIVGLISSASAFDTCSKLTLLPEHFVDHLVEERAACLECQYCDCNGPADECGLLHNAWERVQPGDAMPAGD